MTELEQKVRELAILREVVGERELNVEIAQEHLEDTDEWEGLQKMKSELKHAEGRAKEVYNEVRGIAEGEYRETGDKHPHGAAEIRVFTKLVFDKGDALDYALEHLRQALKLDLRMFKKLAKELDLDFVEVVEDPRVYVAGDLSGYAGPGPPDV